jgi:hypothetical protein
MRKIVYIIGLSAVLASCFKKQQTNSTGSEDKVSTSLVSESKNDNITPKDEEYFSKQKDFEKFIYSKKWVDLADEAPCHEYARSITIKDGYFNEYNGIEPSKCKIENVRQFDSKTLEITIKDNCNYGNIFKVKILNYDQNLVEWTIFKGRTFKAKPYEVICSNYKEDIYKPKESSFAKKWEGFYKFSDAKEDEDWREGKDYDLYISLDSINLKSYGYQHVRDRKSYAIEKEGCLFVYSQEPEEELLLKLILKDNEYIATSLIDKKGEFKVLKKN